MYSFPFLPQSEMLDRYRYQGCVLSTEREHDYYSLALTLEVKGNSLHD